MIRRRNFGGLILISVAFAGMSYLELFKDEYRLYKMRDPLANTQYVNEIVKQIGALKWVLTLFFNGQPVKGIDATRG
jgi:hypothetical protein